MSGLCSHSRRGAANTATALASRLLVLRQPQGRDACELLATAPAPAAAPAAAAAAAAAAASATAAADAHQPGCWQQQELQQHLFFQQGQSTVCLPQGAAAMWQQPQLVRQLQSQLPWQQQTLTGCSIGSGRQLTAMGCPAGSRRAAAAASQWRCSVSILSAPRDCSRDCFNVGSRPAAAATAAAAAAASATSAAGVTAASRMPTASPPTLSALQDRLVKDWQTRRLRPQQQQQALVLLRPGVAYGYGRRSHSTAQDEHAHRNGDGEEVGEDEGYGEQEKEVEDEEDEEHGESLATVQWSKVMANSINLIGVSSNVDGRQLPSGSFLTTFRLCVRRPKKGGFVKDWYDAEVWDGMGRVASQQLRDGSRIAVQGRIALEANLQQPDIIRPTLKVERLALVLTKAEEQGLPNPTLEQRQPTVVNSGGYAWAEVETAWTLVFTDPAQFTDNRPLKARGEVSARFPDFKHRKTGRGLWLDSRSTPSWVADTLAKLDRATLMAQQMKGVGSPAAPLASPAAPGGMDVGGGSGGVREKVQKAWLELRDDFDSFYDNRLDKRSPNSPDFKHKSTGVSLWLSGRDTPAWVLQWLQQHQPEPGSGPGRSGVHQSYADASLQDSHSHVLCSGDEDDMDEGIALNNHYDRPPGR